MTTVGSPARTTVVRDTLAMLRRDAIHSRRNPMLTASSVGTPVVMLLLFAGVFGDAMGRTVGDHGRYIDYLTPGIILMALGSSVSGTAITACIDKTEGVVARFKTMAIARTSVLTGQVLGSTIRTVIGTVFVLGVAVLFGFRPQGFGLGWLLGLGLVAAVAFAWGWLGVGIGLYARTVAGANSLGLLASLLTFISPAFVPTESMPAGVRWFAQNQPYAPLIDTLRALLAGGPVDVGRAGLALAWVILIGVAGYAWARHGYNADPSASTGSAAALMSH